MGCKISTTLKKFESLQNTQNRELLEDFYRYRQSLDHRSGFATNNILTLMISLDKFLNSRPFTEVVKKEQILEFLDLIQLKRGSGLNGNMILKGDGLLLGDNISYGLRLFLDG
jgi:hypothetical protein